MASLTKRLILGGSIVLFTLAWLGVLTVFVSTDSLAAFTVAVTIAALATEALIWVLAILGGWTIFSNRKKIWRRVTRRFVEQGDY